MIKIENVVLPSAEQWKAIIMGTRNPMNSWDRSDSFACETCKWNIAGYGIDMAEECEGCTPSNSKYEPKSEEIVLGENDLSLMARLAKAGTDHRKFMRMIPVYMDITAPLYWVSELDTYKVGVVRNSCSFMHKGVSKPFEIDDFSLKDERIYKALRPLEKKKYKLEYPYETNEYRIYTDYNNKTYRVYKNGLVIREGFDYTDNYGSGRTRHFDDSKATVWQNKNGYFLVKLSGRNGGQIPLHRLVASVWCDKPQGANQVNHKDGNKGNNSADNLEWVTASENVQHALSTGLYDELGGIHHRYKLWKNGIKLIPVEKRMEFKRDCIDGFDYKELAKKWNITPSQANNIRYNIKNYEYEDLFQECCVWETVIEQLNYLRSLYLETNDEKIFQAIRCLVPQGYMQKSTYLVNYEVLANIYKARKNHKLDEWHDFCNWIETLPYSQIITGKESEEDNEVRSNQS